MGFHVNLGECIPDCLDLLNACNIDDGRNLAPLSVPKLLALLAVVGLRVVQGFLRQR